MVCSKRCSRGHMVSFSVSKICHRTSEPFAKAPNANFYFGNAIGYACFQFLTKGCWGFTILRIVLVVDSVGAMLNHNRALKKCNSNHQKVKN
ncbi:hypothetical protein F2Q70_00001237 [Brassica cretica]|uniref:Uncharacterized protein n=1 Tax=Brassica cretica TaxID=69181 RepID=A0A8S9IQT8_BRACR|nr:hypothetical protein F2Q70_00001237 [Brassica cretica]